MLLAGGSSFSSSSNLTATKVPKTDVKKPIRATNLPSVCKLQAGNKCLFQILQIFN